MIFKNKLIKITWFRHGHENRNDLLRFSLILASNDSKINYRERAFSEIYENGFDTAIKKYHDIRHRSFLLVQYQDKRIKCIVDSEDSFALMNDLVRYVDIYFCAGYSEDLFDKQLAISGYKWQTEQEVHWYKEKTERMIKDFGNEFYKIKKFIPIAPNLSPRITDQALLTQKVRNLKNKFSEALGAGFHYNNDLNGITQRYNHLLSLRGLPLKYDVVLNDSLWGWPKHRISLHNELKNLQKKGFNVYSKLNYTPAVSNDGSDKLTILESDFPMVTASIVGNYEEMISQSKLAVFACGFHWGWRNIMMLALMTGVPVMTDKLLLTPYFDMNEFILFEHEAESWDSVESNLLQISSERWQEIKVHNQFVYDKYMSPTAVFDYFINAFDL